MAEILDYIEILHIYTNFKTSQVGCSFMEVCTYVYSYTCNARLRFYCLYLTSIFQLEQMRVDPTYYDNFAYVSHVNK